MNRYALTLLLCIPISALAQTKPTGSCPFDGFESDAHKQPDLAEVATPTPATTWMACDSPRGCVSLKAEPGSPVLIYSTASEWTCGYSADRHGAGPAWFRSKDLKQLEFPSNPPVSAWYGVWKGGEDRVVISPGKNGKELHLVGNAVWQGLNADEHFGDAKGNAVPSGNRLHFVDGGCTIDLTLAGKFILADDNQGCGGMNARFSGFWKRVNPSRTVISKP